MEISGTYFPSFLQDLQATFGIRGGCLVRKMPPQPGKKNVPNSTAEKTAVYYIKHFSSLQDLRIFFLVATSCHHLRHLRPSVRSILSTKPWPPWHLDKLWQGAVARQVHQCLDRPKATAPNVTCAHLQFRPLNEAPPTHLGSAPKRQEHPNVQRSSTCKKWPKPFFCLSLSLSLSLRTSTVVANLQTMCRCLSASWPWWLQGSLHLDFVGRCFGGQSSPISGAPPPCHTLPPINNEVWKGNGHRKIFQEERERQQTRHTHNQCISETHEARHANH